MDCTESIILLSEFHDDALDEHRRVEVQTHLSDCPPCADVLRDLDEIVHRAVTLREYQEINFPDEDVLWLRMGLRERKIH